MKNVLKFVKNMPKFQKIQLLLSIIPYASTIAIFFITYWYSMVKYKKKKLNFIIVSIFSLIIGFLCLNVLPVYLGEIWSTFIAIFCLIPLNFLQIRTQAMLIAEKNVSDPKQDAQEDNSSNKELPDAETKKSNMKTILIVVGVILIVMAMIVAVLLHVKHQYNNSRILDTNGENDFTPVTITVEDVINKKEIDEIMFVNSFGNNELDAPEGYTSSHRYTGKSKSYNGYRQIFELSPQSNTVTIDSTVSAISGNFKMFILIDNEYYKDLNIHGEDSIAIENAKSKNISLYIIGEDANFDFEVCYKTK